MKRREFIGIAAVTAVGRGWLAAARAEESVPAALARPRLLGILRDPRIVEQLVLKYRETVPAEAEVEGLLRAMFGAPPSQIEPALVARVDEMIRRDFAEDRTITVGGWVLAVTEARQCALFSLLAT